VCALVSACVYVFSEQREKEKDAHGGTEMEFKEVCDGRELKEFAETNIM